MSQSIPWDTNSVLLQRSKNNRGLNKRDVYCPLLEKCRLVMEGEELHNYQRPGLFPPHSATHGFPFMVKMAVPDPNTRSAFQAAERRKKESRRNVLSL